MASPLLLLSFGALTLSSSWAANGSAAPTVTVTVAAVLPEHNLGYLGAWPRVGPALDLALEALEPQLRPAGLAVRVIFASSDENGTCSWDQVQQSIGKLLGSQFSNVLLGLGCHLPDFNAKGWAWLWDLPLLSAGDERDWGFFSTTVYAGPAGRDFSFFLSLLEQHFNWTSRAVFVFSHDARGFPTFFYKLFRDMKSAGSHSVFNLSLDGRPEEALQFIQAHGRVAFIQGSPETVQQAMHLAQAQNMTNGDYVFIYLDILGESLEAAGHREAAKPWQSKEGRDAGDLQEAFQTVLIITAYKPQTPEYRHFQSELILRAQRDFGVALNDSLGKNLVAGCFHDVLLLYIRALNETLHEGGTEEHTRRILRKMRGLKIQGVTGMVSLNNFNEREMDFDLWSMADVESGQFQVVGRYVGSEERIEWLEPIHWKKGCPPVNSPPCDFNTNGTSYAKGILEKESPRLAQSETQEQTLSAELTQ